MLRISKKMIRGPRQPVEGADGFTRQEIEFVSREVNIVHATEESPDPFDIRQKRMTKKGKSAQRSNPHASLTDRR